MKSMKVENYIKYKFSESIAVLFDEQSAGFTRYVFVVATFSKEFLSGSKTFLLGMKLMGEESVQSAADYVECFGFMIDLFDKIRMNTQNSSGSMGKNLSLCDMRVQFY